MSTSNKPNINKYEVVESKDDQGVVTRKFYDEHTLYIENNGRSDDEVLNLIDKIIASHPLFNELYPPAKPFRRGAEYFNKSVHSPAREGKDPKPARDCTYIFVTNIYLYRYIICRDTETGKKTVRRSLTPEEVEQKRAKTLQYYSSKMSSWADDMDEGDMLENEYDLLTRPYHVEGITIFDDQFKERHWKRFMSKPTDVAVMRGYVSRVRDGLVPNRLIVSNLPSVIFDESYSLTIAKRFGTTLSKFSPTIKYELYTDRVTTKPRARMIITYDPDTMDASFASIFFSNYIIKNVTTKEDIQLRCEYERVKARR